MSYYTRKEIDDLHDDIASLAAKATTDEEEKRSVITSIEHSLHSGYDHRRMCEKLEKYLDAKHSARLVEKLQSRLDEYKRKSRKRTGGSTDDSVKSEISAPEAPKKSRFDVVIPSSNGDKASALPKVTTNPVISLPVAPPTLTTVPSALSSNQIKMMMVNAQREIEERKRALTQLKAKDPLLASVPQIGLPVAMASQALSKQPPPEDVDKAKKIAELQAQIRAKLSGSLANLIQQPGVPAATDRPKPLILDEDGRTIDKSGRTVNIPTLTPTLKANIRAKKREVFNKSQTNTERSSTQEDSVKFFDDRIALKPGNRNKRALRFHEPGKFQQMAERMRMKAQLERLQNEISQIARKTGISSATKLALIAPKQDTPDDVPSMEWWDSVILSNDLNTLDEDGKISIRQSAITNLIEHPTQMKPPSKYFCSIQIFKWLKILFFIKKTNVFK